MKGAHVAILITSAVLLLQLLLIVLFIILQVVVNPRNYPQEFSIIPGGNRRISHFGDVCHNIELNTFTPDIRTTVYLSRINVVSTEIKKEEIFVNNILEVGYSSSQLTYCGIPVEGSDEVSLNISSSNRSLNSLSVVVTVYEVEGINEFLDSISQNTDPLSRYDLDSCLLTTGCVLNLEAEFDGWLYVIFESTPTPTTLNISMEATVHKYNLYFLDTSSECTLFRSSTLCHIEVPTDVYYDDGVHIDYLPFALIYQAESLLSDTPTPSQGLNVSVDLTWTCSRTDLDSYIILIAMLSVTSVFTVILLTCAIWRAILYCDCDCDFTLPSVNSCRNTHPRRNHYKTSATDVTNVTLEEISPSSIVKISYDITESLPSYEKAMEATTEQDDELPYLEK